MRWLQLSHVQPQEDGVQHTLRVGKSSEARTPMLLPHSSTCSCVGSKGASCSSGGSLLRRLSDTRCILEASLATKVSFKGVTDSPTHLICRQFRSMHAQQWESLRGMRSCCGLCLGRRNGDKTTSSPAVSKNRDAIEQGAYNAPRTSIVLIIGPCYLFWRSSRILVRFEHRPADEGSKAGPRDDVALAVKRVPEATKSFS